MASILKEKDIKDNSILSSMLNSPAFCNSDKYSFTLALNEIPLQQMNMMEEDVQGREEILNDQLGVSQNISDQENKKVIYRQYIHDLYRFFKLWNFRKQVDDIFTSPLTFWSLSTFKSHFTTTRYGKEIADHLLSKGYYEEAISLYTYLTQEEPTNIEFLQKAGFAHQKNEKYEKALDFYKKGFILDPLDLWTIKHIALCYRKMHKDQDALDFFKMAERHDPDNLNITLQIGHCLTSLFEFDEALKYFFKVEYLSQAKVSAHRAIAWCYFMTDKIEKAAHYYEKIIQESTPIFTDWLNYGHVFLVQEDIPNAVSCYKKAMALCESCKDLDDIILDDTPILMSKGVDEVILAITEDLVETNN